MTETMADLTARKEAIRSLPPFIPKEERKKHSITDIKPGGIIAIGDLVYRVDERHRYEDSEGFKWYEVKLFNLTDSTTAGLEWETDDELEVTFGDRQLGLGELPISKPTLDRMDDEESGQFTLNGTTFVYDESDKAKFFRNEQGPGEDFYYWDFKSLTSDRFIGIERWGSEYQVWYSHSIKPIDIDILNLGGE